MNMKTMLGAIVVSASAVAAADAPSFQWQVGQVASDWAVLSLNFYDSDGNGLKDKYQTGDFKFENKERALPFYLFDKIDEDGKVYIKDATGNFHEVSYLKFSLFSTYSDGTASGWLGNTTTYGVNYGDANTQKTAIKWADVWKALKSGGNYAVDVKKNVADEIQQICTINLFSFALKWKVESTAEWDTLRFGFINGDKSWPASSFPRTQMTDGVWQGFVEAVTNYTGEFYFDISKNGENVGYTGWNDWWGPDGSEGKRLTWTDVMNVIGKGRFVRKLRLNRPNHYATEVGTLTLAADLGQDLNFRLADGRVDAKAYPYAVDASEAGTVTVDFESAEPGVGVYTLVSATELMDIDLSKWTLKTTVNGVETPLKGRRARLRCAKNDEGKAASLQLKISLGGLALIIR